MSARRPLPPILPATRRPDFNTDTTAAPTTNESVTAACEACRRRKSKCSGTRPKCGSCLRRSRECYYRTNSAETHGKALKRKYEELLSEKYRPSLHQELFDVLKSMSLTEASFVIGRFQAGEAIEALLVQARQGFPSLPKIIGTATPFEEFFHLLRDLSDEEVDRVLQLLRSGHDVTSLLRYIRDADLLLQLSVRPETRRRYEFLHSNKWPDFLLQGHNPYLQAHIYEPHSELSTCAVSVPKADIVYEAPYGAATLLEPQLDGSVIIKWTTVTGDGGLLAKLMELYFLHAYPFFHFFHKDFFLADLKSGKQQSCSSLLVNAVLAAATHFHSAIVGRSQPWDTQSLCYRFFAEAKRLWEMEMGENKLTTLQAALVMNTIYNMNGLDQVGYIYMKQAAKMAHDLNLFMPLESQEYSDTDIARQFTAWGLFSWQAMVCCHYHMPSLLPKPPSAKLPDPAKDSRFYGEVYLKYPLSNTPKPLNFPSVFFHTAKFHLILNNLANRFGAVPRAALSLQEASEYRNNLIQWFQQLPDCLQPSKIAFPVHLQLHLHFEYVIHTLLEPFIKTDSRIALIGTSPKESVIEVVNNSRARFETITRLYYLRHSFATYAPVMLQFLSALGFSLLGEIEKPRVSVYKTEEARSSLILAIHGLFEQAQGAYLSKTVLRLLCDRLPTDFRSITDSFLDLKSVVNDGQILPEFVRAAYPINLVSFDADAEEHRLNTLLQDLQQSSLERDRP